MADHPNVLFLTVDALRSDRTSLYGYERPTTPLMEALAESGMVWDQAVSMGAFTQISFHSFMTSSRPLSYGGFDHGATGRPPTLFSVLHNAGYETIAVGTIPVINRYLGYDAIDRECLTFILNAMVGNCSRLISSALRAWHRGEISVDEAVAKSEPQILKLFEDLGDFCERRSAQASLDRLDFANSPLMNEAYIFSGVLKVVTRHRTEFLRNKRAYMERYLTSVPEAHEWMARDWRYCRTPAKLLGEAAHRIGNRLLGLVNPRLAQLRGCRFKRYVDGADLADRILREIEIRRRPDRPFFLWTHFLDPHIPYAAGRGRRWYRQTPDYLAALGYPRDFDVAVAVGGKPQTEEAWVVWSALYDAVVRYTDEQIGRVIEGLDRLGLRDDTLVVICGDHGEELGEHGDISHHYRLYEHNVKVPVLLHRPGMGRQRIDGLTTVLDLAPTITGLAGVAPDPDWEGQPVTAPSVAQRRHVVLETFHGGSCLFDGRPPYMAVRTARWKYLWKEYLDPTDRYSPEGAELYDLEADPLEQNNLYRPDHPLVPEFNALIAKRLSEIPQISRERIVAAFGENALAPAPDDKEQTLAPHTTRASS